MTRPLALFAVLTLVSPLASREAGAADPSPSKRQCVSANSDAQDLRRDGKLLAAREKLAACVAASCPGPVRADCAERLEDVNKALPSLIFAARDGSGNDLAAVRVAIDGQPLVEKLDGAPIPVDPGSHVFTFEANGLPTAEKTIVVREREQSRRELVVIGARRAPAPNIIKAEASGGGAGGDSRRTIGLVAGIAGGLALVAGSIAGLLELPEASNAQRDCPRGAPNCAQEQSTAHTHATLANVLIPVGVVLGVGGVILFATAPGDGEKANTTAMQITPELGRNDWELLVKGAF